MVTVDYDSFSSLFLILVCMASFFSGSDAKLTTGIISANCSSFTWPNYTTVLWAFISEDIPLAIDVDLLDILCENPSCDTYMCQPGNCSSCVPITADYSNRIFFSAENMDGLGSRPLQGSISCSVGRPNMTNPGHYTVECTAANYLVGGYGDPYWIVMTVMSLDNTTVLASMRSILGFKAGTPVIENTWADFDSPPIAVYHKNMLRLWLRDYMNNIVTKLSSSQPWGTPIPFSVVVTRSSGEPAQLQIPPEPDAYTIMGYYMAPITPIYTGDYIATITVGNVHISNSPLHFTVGETFGIPVRTPSSSTPLILASFLLVVSSTTMTLSCLLQGW